MYINRDTEKVYVPHVYMDDQSRYLVLSKGEGAGGTTFGITMTLDRIRAGHDAVVVSASMNHFKRSTWPEVARWVPWDEVVPEHRYHGEYVWEPYASFRITFINGGTMTCGGMNDPDAWCHIRAKFAFLDEARYMTEKSFKVLNGCVPQLLLVTTPPDGEDHWLYRYFGSRGIYRPETAIGVLPTSYNAANLSQDFVDLRMQVLDDTETRRLLCGTMTI